MRFRLLRRRLTVSAPRMAVRSALPWPFRWAVLAVVFGFCAAIALWAFEFGKEIAGVNGPSDEQTASLRVALEQAQRERDEARSIANTSQTLLTAGRAAQEQLIAQNRQLEQEILSLRDDLGFFEKLIPMSGVESIAVRGLQAELGEDGRLKWRGDSAAKDQGGVQRHAGVQADRPAGGQALADGRSRKRSRHPLYPVRPVPGFPGSARSGGGQVGVGAGHGRLEGQGDGNRQAVTTTGKQHEESTPCSTSASNPRSRA